MVIRGGPPERHPERVVDLDKQLDKTRENNKWVAVLGGPVVIVAVFALAKDAHPTGWVKAALLISLAQIVVGVLGAVPLSRQRINPAELVIHLERRLLQRHRLLQLGVVLFVASIACVAAAVL